MGHLTMQFDSRHNRLQTTNPSNIFRKVKDAIKINYQFLYYSRAGRRRAILTHLSPLRLYSSFMLSFFSALTLSFILPGLLVVHRKARGSGRQGRVVKWGNKSSPPRKTARENSLVSLTVGRYVSFRRAYKFLCTQLLNWYNIYELLSNIYNC